MAARGEGILPFFLLPRPPLHPEARQRQGWCYTTTYLKLIFDLGGVIRAANASKLGQHSAQQKELCHFITVEVSSQGHIELR